MKKLKILIVLIVNFLAILGPLFPKVGFTTQGENFLSLGLMSGTSMDGIDVALIRTNGKFQVEEVGDYSLSYTPAFHRLLKTASYVVHQHTGNMEKAHKANFHQGFYECLKIIFKVEEEEIATSMLKEAIHYLQGDSSTPITLTQIISHSTELHARAVQQLLENTGYNSSQIDVIGYHGQTLYHNPAKGITIQVGNGQQLANILGISVVNDFRSQDVAHGGQGAPFAPLYHQALAVRDQYYPLAIVNCGGISNISLIGGLEFKDIVGYDTGPGNGLVDRFVKQRTKFSENMDLNGKYGLQGKVHLDILDKLFQKSIIKEEINYFDVHPPKSLDENDLKLIPELDKLSLEDGCATLEAFTAESIVKSLQLISLNFPTPRHWVLVGGGWYNPVIRQELETRIKNQFGTDVKVNLAEEIKWNNKAMEAQIFAYLAVRSLQRAPISIPETTKVPKPLSGGHLYQPERLSN